MVLVCLAVQARLVICDAEMLFNYKIHGARWLTVPAATEYLAQRDHVCVVCVTRVSVHPVSLIVIDVFMPVWRQTLLTCVGRHMLITKV